MIIAEIIPITSSILAESLSYFSAMQITPGTVVTIPLRKQKIKGIVLSTSKVQNLKQSLRSQNFKIRNIIQIHNETVFSPAYLQTIQQLKKYYVLPAGKLIDITYPKYILKNFEEFSYFSAKTKPSHQNKYRKKLLQKKYPDRIKYYKNIIIKKIQKGQSVQIICPTILDVKKITHSLETLFEKQIYSLHGKTTKKRISENYQKIQNEASLIISTTSFIDIPAKNKRLIILENDSSPYYFRAITPKIDLRIFIEEYAKNAKLSLFIADSILRPIRFTETENQDVDMEIFSSKKISLISAIDTKKIKQSDSERIKDLSKKKEFSPFSDDLFKLIKKSIKNKEKIFLYTRRKSLAPNIMCSDCGELAQDPITKIPYSLYVQKNIDTGKKEFLYINRINGEILPAFDLCQFCNSWRFQTLGIGTETIKDEIEKHFPQIKTFIVDSTHTKTQTEINNILKEFKNIKNEAVILIATQKGLPYIENIDSSFIVSIDGIFNQISYFNEDRALFIIKTIYDASKKTYLQTRYSKNRKSNLIKNKPEKVKEKKMRLKFSEKTKALIKNIQYPNEFIKNKTSKYTEALNIWELINTGNYLKFIKKSKNNKKIVLKINHICKNNEHQKLYKYYKEIFNEYKPNIKIKSNKKKHYISLQITIHIDKLLWNSKFQDEDVFRILPFGERYIDIEVNPDTF